MVYTPADPLFASGSMCHIFQNFCKLNFILISRYHVSLTNTWFSVLIGHLQHNACIIQPLANPFTSYQLIEMIHDCGLNRLNIFGSFLATHLRNSRLDSKLLQMLAGLDEVIYTGLPLPREEEAWAYTNGIKLRVSDGLCTLDDRGFTLTMLPAERIRVHRSRRAPSLERRMRFRCRAPTSHRGRRVQVCADSSLRRARLHGASA